MSNEKGYYTLTIECVIALFLLKIYKFFSKNGKIRSNAAVT